MTDPVTIVEQRGAAANKTVEGADYQKIVREVAEENGLTYEELRSQCLDRWTVSGAG